MTNDRVSSPIKLTNNPITASVQHNQKMNKIKLSDSGAISSRSLKTKTLFSANMGANFRAIEQPRSISNSQMGNPVVPKSRNPMLADAS